MATSWSGPALKSRRPMRIARSAMFGGATFALTSSPMKAPAKWRFSAARSLSRPGRVDRKASFRSASMIGGATSSKHCARVAKTRAKNGSSSRRSFGQRRISSTSLFRAPFPLLLATQKAITKSSQSCALWSASKSTVSSRMSAANGPDFDSSASAPSLRRSSSMPPSSSMGSFPVPSSSSSGSFSSGASTASPFSSRNPCWRRRSSLRSRFFSFSCSTSSSFRPNESRGTMLRISGRSQ
mmetsp:Transcript_13950/g.52084  ORF Transcript_13950/g.52084 Transcript_13950/m.52084 type:complete len:240 (-) Transcript_13950:1044-1763(-)